MYIIDCRLYGITAVYCRYIGRSYRYIIAVCNKFPHVEKRIGTHTHLGSLATYTHVTRRLPRTMEDLETTYMYYIYSE